MSSVLTSFRTVVLLALLLVSASGLAGCATDPQTAAAAAAGGLLAINLGATALTGSTLEVQIDMYAPTEDQRPSMRLDHQFAVFPADAGRRTAREDDPLHNVTPERIVAISERLRPRMEALEKASASLARSSGQIKTLPSTDPRVKEATDSLDAQGKAATDAVIAWKKFVEDLKANVSTIGQPDVLDTLVGDLLDLSNRLSRASRIEGVTPSYLDLLKSQLRGAVLQDAPAAPPAARTTVTAQVNTAIQAVRDDPKATGAERIAAVLDAFRAPIAASGTSHTNVNQSLAAFGLSLDSARLLNTTSKTQIVEALAPARVSFPIGQVSRPYALSSGAETPDACQGAAAPAVVKRCSADAQQTITASLSRATADVNFGIISNEVQQVLQAAGRGLGIVTDPANDARWRLNAAYAKSSGGAGDHNSLVYFENMGLPIVKSSAFDPTKFIVAQGALYRQVFTAAVAAFGAPLPTTAGPAGGADFQSSNVIGARARIANTQKAATAAREKIVDALKTTIDQQDKIKAGNWSTDKAALIKAAQDALLRAATELEAAAGGTP